MLLEIEDVTKQYGRGVRALDGVSLCLGPGVLGLLGPNGAGKSTLMRIVATIARPTSGRVLWRGVDLAVEPDRLRATLGYLPQDFGIYPNLTAIEFLDYLAAAKGLDRKGMRARIDQLLELVNLVEARKRPIGGFSGGMRQRLGIAQALLNDPMLLIVDEPTAGLDPEERVRFRNLLSELAHERVVILSTHIVSDVEATATTIALLAHGRLLFVGDAESLLSRAQGKVWECGVPASELPPLKARHALSAAIRRPGGVLARLVGEERPTADARPATPTLEDAYLLELGRHRAAQASAVP
jgi:ABC-2 type transport system ATP-binding protein